MPFKESLLITKAFCGRPLYLRGPQALICKLLTMLAFAARRHHPFLVTAISDNLLSNLSGPSTDLSTDITIDSRLARAPSCGVFDRLYAASTHSCRSG